MIDQLLEHPGWADNWVGYWQDVLAENPNIVNPTLNNTGPFRWWIYESLLDNKPLDRFATELILMEGTHAVRRPGGLCGGERERRAAGGQGPESRRWPSWRSTCGVPAATTRRSTTSRRKNLFNLAAMLHRGEQTLPKTSTIPGDDAVACFADRQGHAQAGPEDRPALAV